MIVRHVLPVAAATLALVGLAACATPDPATRPAANAPPTPGPVRPGDAVSDAQRAAFGNGHRGALALATLGGLGQEKGTSDEIRTLGAQIAADSSLLDEELRALATGAGVVLGDQTSADQQTVNTDLHARTGQPFDQAWIRAVLDLQKQVREAANAVFALPNVSPEAVTAARDALARLDAAAATLQQAATSSGASTSTR
ncbi:MAG: DUF4142 domain-containing protein [Pseudonocardia sp.]